MKNYDVIVIGGGPMGLATAAALSKTKKTSLLLEQNKFINQKGSSAGLSRQFREQYAQDYMAKLVVESIPYWDQLQKTTKDVLVNKVGSLWFGDPNISSQEGGIKDAIKVIEQLKIPYTPLDAKQIEEQYPFQNIPATYNGFFQKDGGIINLEATQKALLNICDLALNVDLRAQARVRDIQSQANGKIIVSLEGEDFIAEKLVLTPGAYINKLLNFFGLKVDIDIWEMSSAYYKKTKEIELPTWFVFQDPMNTNLFYGFPEVDWAHPGYIRIAPDIPDRILKDPSERTNIPSKRSLGYNEKWVKDHMVGLDSKSEFTSTCLITLSTNKRLLLLDSLPDTVPNNEKIIVYTGGWAAKFVPLIGQILSDLVVNGTTPYDISEFKIDYLSTTKNK